MTNMSLNRRTLLTGAVALGTVGLLAACGGNKKNETNSALGAGTISRRPYHLTPKTVRNSKKAASYVLLSRESLKILTPSTPTAILQAPSLSKPL